MAKTITFEEFCEDFLDQHIALMDKEQHAEAVRSYQAHLASVKSNRQSAKEEKEALKNNEEAMLAWHGIDKQTFENLTHEQLPAIRKSKDSVGYKDPKRQLWHDFRVAVSKNKVKPQAAASVQNAVKRDDKTQKSLERATEARKAAKALGGKALTGTAKQKAWAEQIRRDFLNMVNADEAELALESNISSSAKFWIETRECTSKDIIACLKGELNYETLAKHTNTVARAKKVERIKKRGW